jgi:hypothetical protein
LGRVIYEHVFTATTMSADQEILKSLLEKADIPCMIRNEYLSMALGELPPTECSPELWILKDEDYPRAKEIVDAWRTPDLKIMVRGFVLIAAKRLKANSLHVGNAEGSDRETHDNAAGRCPRLLHCAPFGALVVEQ